jgi:outer membrane protein insertion porin family
MSSLRIAGAVAVCTVVVLAFPSFAQESTEPEPVLGEIVIEGNTRTDTAVIHRIIGVEPGAPFSYEIFDEVWDRLEDSGFFTFVDLDMADQPDGRVTLNIKVEEDNTLQVLPYARYSRRHKYALGGTLQDHNLRGKGEILDLQVVVYRIQRLRASWTKPWFLGRDGLELEVAGALEQGPFVWRPFHYRQGQGTLRLHQHFAGPFYAELGGGFEVFRQRDAYDWLTPDRGDDAAPAVVSYPEATRDDWLLTAALGLDSRDNPFYPRSGMFHRFAVERRFSSDVPDFTLFSGDARAFIDLPANAILALRAYGRLTDRPLPVEHGLFWGGPETLRGAPYALLEGEEGYLLTAEIRYPLLLMPIAPNGESVGFGLHAFADAGDAWFEGDDPSRAMQSFGGGIHVNVATWQLRFEGAKERDHDWVFVFADEFTF